MAPSSRRSATTAHIINHTHWDREWFLTSTYTTPWIPGLIDRLCELVEANPDFRYILDGQTLVIEDLLQAVPHYRGRVEQLVQGGNLVIGPYYCQPDWRLTGGEALVRNLLYGWRDMQQYGGKAEVGWLVDTFGHISQAPQLHRLFGIHAAYLWRGVPQFEPYFRWQGADGTELFTVHVLGGYRNLYGVTHLPELAIRRLEWETGKLKPLYPTPDIPLFDGYDLESHPEDPVRFYKARRDQLPPDLSVRGTTPGRFARLVRSKLAELPAVGGELISGKYAAVFPGSLSARTYLKVMARDCEHLLYQVCEPLGALACLRGRAYPAQLYEQCGRLLLQNAVHDSLCGVSIDPVHEKMERTYRQVFDDLLGDLPTSLGYVLEDFAPGWYAVSTQAYPNESWQPVGGDLVHVQTWGIGAWPVVERFPIRFPDRPVESFAWKNDWYEARLHPDGRVQVEEARLGALEVYEEHGDTYSEEPGALLGMLQPQGRPRVEQESDRHAVICIPYSAAWEDRWVSGVVRLTFDPSPLIRWQIELDSGGVGLRVEAVFDDGRAGPVAAGMPFDVVRRAPIDRDLLPRPLEGALAGVLMGQREVGAVETFPFHDFVAVPGRDGSKTSAVLAKGLHAYRADEVHGGQGRLRITLRRAVEWLAQPDLPGRVGDAGPHAYVPGARGERVVTHELAWLLSGSSVDEVGFHALNAGYQTPPLLVHVQGEGLRREWAFLRENLPLSSLHVANGRVLARVYNPTGSPQPLTRPYPQTDVFGHREGTVQTLPAKAIRTLGVSERIDPPAHPAPAIARLLNPPAWRVGPHRSGPDPAVLGRMAERIQELEGQVEQTSRRLGDASGTERYRMQHRLYVLQRELYEVRLSMRLNQITGVGLGEGAFDSQVAEIGQRLNELRIQRRIYDYVVQSL